MGIPEKLNAAFRNDPDLRHSAVAILIAQGVNVKAISELLGHSTVAFTLQVYRHLLEETKRRRQP